MIDRRIAHAGKDAFEPFDCIDEAVRRLIEGGSGLVAPRPSETPRPTLARLPARAVKTARLAPTGLVAGRTAVGLAGSLVRGAGR